MNTVPLFRFSVRKWTDHGLSKEEEFYYFSGLKNENAFGAAKRFKSLFTPSFWDGNEIVFCSYIGNMVVPESVELKTKQ